MNHKPTRPTVGPRGGRAVQATPCAECVSWRSCRPGAITEPFGCEGWVDQDGRRALPDELEPGPFERAPVPTVEDAYAIADAVTKLKKSFDPEPATPCEACGGIPSECRPCGCPEVEPEGGFTFETMGGLAKGRCGAPEPVLSNPEPEPEPFRPADPYRPDRLRGEGPAQGCLEIPDAGPLFAGCLEAKS